MLTVGGGEVVVTVLYKLVVSTYKLLLHDFVLLVNDTCKVWLPADKDFWNEKLFQIELFTV